jgi:PAS domain S-box-containing protein
MKLNVDDGHSSVGQDLNLSGTLSDEASKLGKEHFQRLIAEVEDYAIILLDTAGTIVSWNKGAERIKGYMANEILGKNFRIFYPKEDKEAKVPDTLMNTAITEGKANHEGWRVRKDGTRFWGNITITALHADSGELTGFLKVTRDLTERKKAEERLHNYTEQLRQKNEALKRSEERYHKMVSEVQDYAIILLDRDGSILDWNKGAEALKGYKAEEILGKSFRLFYTREDKERDLPGQLLAEAVEQGRVNHEGWRIRKDGTRFWGNVVITSLHSDAGELIGFTKVTRDLTARKIAEDRLNNVAEELIQKNEALRQSEERYHRMIAEVQDYAIILLDKKGYIENWNTGAGYIKGYSAEEIIGKNFRIFYPREDIENNLPERLLYEATVNSKSIHEGWRIRKNGTRFWGSTVITALHDKANNVIGFSKVTRDLTDKKKAEDALRESARQLDLKNKLLERLNDQLSSFAYVAGHDLKEPLRKIQTFASRLAQIEPLSEKGSAYLEKINNGALRMKILIEDLLAYSQITNDDRKFESVDLNTVISAVVSDLEIPVQQQDAIIETKPLPVISGVSFQFHQLFLNLISNSLKFAKPDERPVITVSHRIADKDESRKLFPHTEKLYHVITVKDNGIGFEQEYATRIFDVFQRLHPKEAFSGTGIGLAIVKRVTENHGGVVLAESKPGLGAAFHLYLPVSE